MSEHALGDGPEIGDGEGCIRRRLHLTPERAEVCEIVSTIALSLCTVVEDGSESIEGCAANRVSDILVPT